MTIGNEFGSLYLDDNTGVTVTISEAGTYVEVDTLTAGPNSHYVSEDAAAGRLKLSKGTHLVLWSASLSSGASNQIEGAILKNGATEQAQTIGRVMSDNAVEHISGMGLVESDGDDEFSLGLKNVTDTDNVTLHQCQIVAIGLRTSPPRPGAPD